MHEINTQSQLAGLKSWFKKYVQGFYSDDLIIQENIRLKEFHTLRVCEAILDIGGTLDLSNRDLCFAEISALLHDIGRFEQFRRYGTFSDFRSEDHADLGVKVIQESRILVAFDPNIAEMIIRLVGFHNKATLPEGEDKRFIFFLKLLRDADKADIWRVVTEYYQNAGHKRNQAIELELSDNQKVSEPVYEALMNRRVVDMSGLKTINDFKMLQMGWIYDLHFPRTFEIVRENRYLEKIRDSISGDSERIEEIYTRTRSYLKYKCPSI